MVDENVNFNIKVINPIETNYITWQIFSAFVE